MAGDMAAGAGRPIEVNGRGYAWPRRPTVVVCVDGSEPAYMEEAVRAGRMPTVASMAAAGADLRVHSALPSFTNPNNMSIVTGVPPVRHGISGNYFFDPATGREVMMDDPALLRADSILAAFAAAGARVAAVTAKDKLRRMLARGVAGEGAAGICFSAERSAGTTRAEHGLDDAAAFVGLPQPEVYSGDLSTFVLAAGVRLMEQVRPDILYLSTSDYVQHKHAPGTGPANAFYAELDRHLGALDAMGAVIAVTADHGMNAKHRADGSPDVLYLQDRLDAWLGPDAARVILPITDPYVRHHGALGSFATVYLPPGTSAAEAAARIAAIEGIEAVATRAQAVERFELPADRIGDVVAFSSRGTVIGTSAARHDLSGLDVPLRSHGGLTEQTVPMVLNRPPRGLAPGRRLRNFDAFDLALNAVA